MQKSLYSRKGALYFRCRALCPCKRGLFLRKSDVYTYAYITSSDETGLEIAYILHKGIRAKEIYILAKGPDILAKQPFILAKETYILAKETHILAPSPESYLHKHDAPHAYHNSVSSQKSCIFIF